MAHLSTVGGIFHGRVLSARLGAEGILTELRGDIGATYPLGGEVHVFVDASQLEPARHILLADQVEAALATSADGSGWEGEEVVEPLHRRHPAWARLAWALLAVLVALYVLSMVG